VAVKRSESVQENYLGLREGEKNQIPFEIELQGTTEGHWGRGWGVGGGVCFRDHSRLSQRKKKNKHLQVSASNVKRGLKNISKLTNGEGERSVYKRKGKCRKLLKENGSKRSTPRRRERTQVPKKKLR